jgi:hypothetical protein
MIKPGVDLRGIKPQMAIAYSIAQAIYHRHSGQSACVITSASDGTHGPNSLHYQGLALDLRTSNVIPALMLKIVRDLKLELGLQFDVVDEGDHVHIEFQPKDDTGKALDT